MNNYYITVKLNNGSIMPMKIKAESESKAITKLKKEYKNIRRMTLYMFASPTYWRTVSSPIIRHVIIIYADAYRCVTSMEVFPRGLLKHFKQLRT